MFVPLSVRVVMEIEGGLMCRNLHSPFRQFTDTVLRDVEEETPIRTKQES